MAAARMIGGERVSDWVELARGARASADSGALLQLAQRHPSLEHAHVIDHEDAVEMVVLVLDGNAEEPVGFSSTGSPRSSWPAR